MIFERLREWSSRGISEPAWNSEVHSSLLHLALRGECEANGVWYCDLSTSELHDSALLPTIVDGSMSFKMVDYALVLKSSLAIRTARPELTVFRKHIVEKLMNESRLNINHAIFEAI